MLNDGKKMRNHTTIPITSSTLYTDKLDRDGHPALVIVVRINSVETQIYCVLRIIYDYAYHFFAAYFPS